MTQFVPHGGLVYVVLETDDGQTRIIGKTHDSTYIPQGGPMFGDWPLDDGRPCRSIRVGRCTLGVASQPTG